MSSIVHSVDTDTARLAAAIGARIRVARRTRDWTLDRLAESAKLSRRMLSDVERGTVNPSIGTLLRVSDALGVPLSELVDAPDRDPLAVVRRGSETVLWRGASGGRGALLGSARSDLGLELWDWSLAAGDEKRSDPHRAGTREVLTVLDGTVAVTVGERRVVLDVGDTVGIPGDEPHGYRAEHSSGARFILAVAEPNARRQDVVAAVRDAHPVAAAAGAVAAGNRYEGADRSRR